MKLRLVILALMMLLFTACENNDNHKVTTAKEIEQNLAPYMLICDGVLHDTGNAIVLYEGPESLYDEKTTLDGYVSIGDTVKEVSSSTSPTKEMHSNFLKEGTTIYYNKEKNSYAYCVFGEELSVIGVYEHTCNDYCKKITD